MDELLFRITTTDQTVLNRWQVAFKKEGWEANVCCHLPQPYTSACRAEFYLIEVGTPLCKTPEILKEFIKGTKPVATLAFAAPERISNSLISRYLEAGADDFILKNLDERILVAKLKAYIRRLAPAISAAIPLLATSSGDIKIDSGSRVVTLKARHGKNMEIVNLTQKELEVLAMLVGKEKHVISRESMLEKLWGNGGADVYSECIDKHIESLRRKLGIYGKRIKTVYGAGYMLTEGE